MFGTHLALEVAHPHKLSNLSRKFERPGAKIKGVREHYSI
jgi:hypothetical protein